MTTASFVERYETLSSDMQRLGAELPDVVGSFGKLHAASTAPGALEPRIKELIALSIGIAVHCDGCIAYHVHDALKAGASRAEVLETIGVAVMMGGGPSVVYGCDALTALDEFEAAQ